jgi:transposase
MAVADRNGLPVSVCAKSATPHEVTLAISTLLQMVVPDAPQNLIGDNAYDSDRLDAELRLYGIEVIAPHRRNRRNSTQDGRRLKRYRRRWKIERLFAWLQNFRRLVVRYERHAENFLGMLTLAEKAKGINGYVIQVKGYASASGSTALNQKLSEERANNVTSILLQQGHVPLTNMLAPGAMGESEQVGKDKTTDTEAENRRVVVRILQNKGIAGP